MPASRITEAETELAGVADGPGVALAHGGDAAGQLPAIPSREAQAAGVVLAGVVEALGGGTDERMLHGRPLSARERSERPGRTPRRR